MDALIRKAYTYGGYDEHWQDGRLYIQYHRAREYNVIKRGGKWTPEDSVGELMCSYLVSSAVFCDALERCRQYSYAPEKIYEFIDCDAASLIPSELLRLLMDDAGLGMDSALKAVVSCFGDALIDQPDRDWLFDMQPRTAFLQKVLQDALRRSPLAFHDEYDEKYRRRTGAVEEGTAVELSIAAFGGVDYACLVVWGDSFRLELPMQKSGGYFTAEFTPEAPAALFYAFKLNGGSAYLRPDYGDGFRLTVYKRGFETPAWFRRGIMYQVFPDRFGFSDDGTAQRGIEYHRSLGQTPQLHGSIDELVKWQPSGGARDYAPDDFYGGTLRGIAARLPYLKELGITVLYLNPIVEARSNHRYDTSNYEKVDPILGTVDDYVNLCTEAKRVGISIINDGVFSHTGADSIYFDRYGSYGGKGAYSDRSSAFYKWFDFSSYPDDYRCWWGFKDLPEVNEEDESWQDYIVSGNNSIVKLWLRLGASGWRLDVADELPDDVLALIRSAVKSEKPDGVIIGEVWEDAVTKVSYGKRRNYALGYSLDSVMNYPFRASVIAFARGKISAFELRDALRQQQYNYPAPLYYALMNLLSSHDVERLHTALGADSDNVKELSRAQQASLRLSSEQTERATRLQMLCAAIQYCAPGVPCLYYGDEQCLDGAGDPFDRAPFEPDGSGLHNFYCRLGGIRNSSKALIYGSAEFSAASPDVLIIRRKHENDRITCIINRSAVGYAVNMPDAAPLLGSCSNGILPPYSAEIFKFT